MHHYVRDLILLGVLFFSTSKSPILTQEVFYSDKEITEILDSAYFINGLQDYNVLAKYLEQLDPKDIKNDTLAMRYYYRSNIAYGHLDWHELTCS